MSRIRKPSVWAFAWLSLSALASPAEAQEFFAAPRDFVVTKACTATRSIRTGGDPTPLLVDTTYAARGVNRRQDPTHVYVRVGSDSKWVELGCGRFADGLAATAPGDAPVAPTSSAGPACLPFFDEADNKVEVPVGGLVDITPKPPQLDAFDRAVNATCGAPGKVVSPDEFKAMMRAHPDVLERVRAFTRGSVFKGSTPAGSEAFLDELTRAWFAVHAFDHIFCGEPSATGGGKIGGLHFHGRYLQLQQSGQACRMSNYAQNEVVPDVIYTMGVMMQTADGRMVRDARKGYGLTLSAEDLLKVITRAFAENPTGSSETTACLLPLRDDGHEFTAVFARRAQGIRTFYPDATPNGRGTRQRNPPCAGRIDTRP